MEGKQYQPQPLDTTDIQLPDKLMPLIEQMARNVHEVWAEGRVSQGWTWGPERSDRLRQHPCLVSYDDLSEEERDYDRHTALSTLRLIMKLGFDIVPRSARRDACQSKNTHYPSPITQRESEHTLYET